MANLLRFARRRIRYRRSDTAARLARTPQSPAAVGVSSSYPYVLVVDDDDSPP